MELAKDWRTDRMLRRLDALLVVANNRHVFLLSGNGDLIEPDDGIIAIGSGPHAHGQVLIYHDLFGLYPKFKPRMAKVYADAGNLILNGLKQYVNEVTSKTFPQPENWFEMKEAEYEELMKLLEE